MVTNNGSPADTARDLDATNITSVSCNSEEPLLYAILLCDVDSFAQHEAVYMRFSPQCENFFPELTNCRGGSQNVRNIGLFEDADNVTWSNGMMTRSDTATLGTEVSASRCIKVKSTVKTIK